MNEPVRTQWQIRCAFNGYCKRALKNEAVNAHRDTKRQQLREVTFSDLSPQEENQLYTYDRYFGDDEAEQSFCVAGKEITAKLLAEAGVKLPLKVQLWTNEYKPRRDLAQIIQSQLADVGIEVEIKVLEWGAYLDGLKQKAQDMFILGWVASVPDAEFALNGVLKSTGGSNYTFFSDPTFDAMLDKGAMMPDGAEREKVYMDAQVRIDEMCPWVYLYNEETLHGTQKNIKGFDPSARGFHVLTNVTF